MIDYFISGLFRSCAIEPIGALRYTHGQSFRQRCKPDVCAIQKLFYLACGRDVVEYVPPEYNKRLVVAQGSWRDEHPMPHAKSLRAIGQSLEALGVVAFVMQKDGRNYVIQADSFPHLTTLANKKNFSEKIWDLPSLVKKTSELLKENGSLSFLPPYVSWLDAQGRKKRRKRQSAQASGTMKLSQLLRTVGRHLDRLEPHAFTISWSATGATIHYELADGQEINETLSLEKIRELTLRMRFQRSRRK